MPSFLPARRLLWAVFAVVILATLAGPLPELAPVWMLAFAGLVIFALADLALSIQAARPPSVSVPAVVRLQRDRPGHFAVTFTHDGTESRRIRFGIGLPAGCESEQPDVIVDLPAGVPHAKIEWRCTGRRRGIFHRPFAATENGSRFGLWLLRRRETLECEIRVYPNLFSERRALATLFLDRGETGAKLQRTIGRGREFEKLRDYLPGDGFDEIHWKATGKRGKPITKIFQAERTQEVYVIIDASRLSGRAVTHEGITQTALERYLTATLVLLLAAQRQGDRFGLLTYDDRVRTFLRAGNGASHYGACREAIHALQPSDGTPDLAEIVRYLRTNLRRRSLLFFLTDLSDPVLAEDFQRNARLLARQHLVLVNQLRAPGVGPLFSTGEVQTVADIYDRVAGHARWSEARALGQSLRPLGVTTNLLEDEGLAAQLVTQYLQVKRRQAL